MSSMTGTIFFCLSTAFLPILVTKPPFFTRTINHILRSVLTCVVLKSPTTVLHSGSIKILVAATDYERQHKHKFFFCKFLNVRNFYPSSTERIIKHVPNCEFCFLWRWTLPAMWFKAKLNASPKEFTTFIQTRLWPGFLVSMAVEPRQENHLKPGSALLSLLQGKTISSHINGVYGSPAWILFFFL